MKAYFQDLREKVMAAVAQDKQSNRQIAELWSAHNDLVVYILRRGNDHGVQISVRDHLAIVGE